MSKYGIQIVRRVEARVEAARRVPLVAAKRGQRRELERVRRIERRVEVREAPVDERPPVRVDELVAVHQVGDHVLRDLQLAVDSTRGEGVLHRPGAVEHDPHVVARPRVDDVEGILPRSTMHGAAWAPVWFQAIAIRTAHSASADLLKSCVRSMVLSRKEFLFIVIPA